MEFEEIPPELVLNWDQAGIKLVPLAFWTMHERGSRRVQQVGIEERESLGEDKAAVIIMDNFKAQITTTINEILEQHSVHSCLLPPNTTDRLQPMNLSVNKPTKAFLRSEFHQIMQQLDNPTANFSTAELNPVDLSMVRLQTNGLS